jgi:diguanylate cyclase (GGDEF)-like protein/PAS domain S-box-containing protein
MGGLVEQSPHQRWLTIKTMRAVVALALLYAIVGKLAMLLALPPGYATAIFPPAGIALAVVAVGGVRFLPGVVLGSFALALSQGLENPAVPLMLSLLAASIVAGASTLQAWVGSLLFKRRVRLELDSAHDVILFLLAAPVICLISASIGIAGFFALGIMPAAALPANWLTWWIGDTIGILLGAPLTWIAIGQPRQLWHRRRWLLSLPLGIASSAFIAIYVTVSQWEANQQMHTFGLRSQQVGERLQQQFNEHERILYTFAQLFNQRQAISPAEFRDIARSYLDQRPELRAMSWMPRVTLSERAGFERWAQQHVSADYTLRQVDPELRHVSAASEPQYYPITYIEPTADNLHVLGVDMLSEAQRAKAIHLATERRRPSASAPFMLMHHSGNKTAILLTQAIHGAGENAQSAPLGMLGLALQITPYLERTLAKANFAEFPIRFEDITDPHQVHVMLDVIGRALQPGDYQRRLELGGRSYQLTLAPSNAYLASHRGWQSWTTLVGGLLLTGLLGAFLLLMSGQRVQMERRVQDRTRDLQEREAKLSAILDQAADAILTIARNGRVLSVNGAAETLFGYPLARMQEMALSQLVDTDNMENGAQLLERLSPRSFSQEVLVGRHASGKTFPISVAVSLVEVTNETFYVCMLRDLTEHQLAQEKIYHLAHHDSLTGLANRFMLNLRLQTLLHEAALRQSALALMFIDLDHFKKINDSLGHHVGDQLLAQAGARLQQLLPQAAVLARLGNDEFIIVLQDMGSDQDIGALAQSTIDAMRVPFQVNGQRLQSGASIGISRFPNDGADADTLLRHADAAVLAAKEQGRGKYQVFTPALIAAAQERLQMEQHIWQALEQRQFELYLQPQVHLGSRQFIGAEALLRWRHPERGFIPPDRFIPIAEESGLILPLGEWVLERALHILADWQARALPPIRLAVNLSARQCHSGTLLACLDRLQAVKPVNLQWLEMEITETAAMQDPEMTRELLRQLRLRGIKVAIDDFGTGYSSLTYLKLFEIDRIKIDRSFVKDIENDENDAVIASATIALAHTLGLEVVAEGIETEAQSAFLNHELCDEGQGYLFGKPMPVADFEALLRAASANRPTCYA